MSEITRTPLTSDLVSAMAAAGGRPVAPDEISDVTGLIVALYDLEAKLDQFDVTAVEPEFKWNARWERSE